MAVFVIAGARRMQNYFGSLSFIQIFPLKLGKHPFTFWKFRLQLRNRQNFHARLNQYVIRVKIIKNIRNIFATEKSSTILEIYLQLKNWQNFHARLNQYVIVVKIIITIREGFNWEKKTFSFGHCPNYGGGGLPMPEFFGPLFRVAFLVKKKSLFLQKCQCIELLTVF